MTATPETSANALADALAKAEAALTKAEAEVKQFFRTLSDAGSPIGQVTQTAIRGQIAGAAGLLAAAHLAVTPFDPRPHPMDGGGGK